MVHEKISREVDAPLEYHSSRTGELCQRNGQIGHADVQETGAMEHGGNATGIIL